MKVLVACERSGIVRDAFAKQGHLAVSCDLEDSDTIGIHKQMDILELLKHDIDWDLMIAFPPCTHLAVSGAAWFKDKKADGRQDRAIDFFLALYDAKIPRIAIENPVGVMSTTFRKPDQIIQPWMFGTPERKTTCLWLRNLPKLTPTNDVKAELDAKPKNKQNPLHYLPPSKNRSYLRSKTYQGIADAMAEQWGKL